MHCTAQIAYKTWKFWMLAIIPLFLMLCHMMFEGIHSMKHKPTHWAVKTPCANTFPLVTDQRALVGKVAAAVFTLIRSEVTRLTGVVVTTQVHVSIIFCWNTDNINFTGIAVVFENDHLCGNFLEKNIVTHTQLHSLCLPLISILPNKTHTTYLFNFIPQPNWQMR